MLRFVKKMSKNQAFIYRIVGISSSFYLYEWNGVRNENDEYFVC